MPKPSSTGEDSLCPHTGPPFNFKTQYGLGFNQLNDEIIVDFFCCGGGAGIDICLRMLQPAELYNTQGFQADYTISHGADGSPSPKPSRYICAEIVSVHPRWLRLLKPTIRGVLSAAEMKPHSPIRDGLVAITKAVGSNLFLIRRA